MSNTTITNNTNNITTSTSNSKNMASTTMLFIMVLFIGILIRMMCFNIFETNPSLHLFISERVEISTPKSSWKSFSEGIFLRKHNLSPYSNDVFHSSPMLLKLFEIATDLSSIKQLPITEIIFVLFDMITMINLYYISYSSQQHYIKQYKNNNNKTDKQYIDITIITH
eukprot:352783_1